MKKILKALLLFLSGCLIGPLGDFVHVVSKTTAYPENSSPWKILKSPWWFCILIGFAVLILGSLYSYFNKNDRIEKLTFWHCGFAILAYLGIYSLSGYLPFHSITWNSLLMASLALILWRIVCFDRYCFYWGIVLGIVGTATEILLSQAGYFSYYPQSRQLFGVAPWLPFLYFASAPVIALFSKYLDQILHLKNRSRFKN